MAETSEITLGDLKVRLRLDDSGLSADIAKSKQTLGTLEQTAARVGKTVGVAVGATVTAIGVALGFALKRADDLNKASQKIGVAVESLSRLEYAARLADVELDTLTQSVGKLNRNMSEIAGGGGKAAKDSLDALGLSVMDTSGQLKNTETLIGDIAQRFSELEDGPRKTAIAMDLFGKSGAQMIPFLNAGRDGLKEMADEADRLGITISARTAAAAEKFNDGLTRLNGAVQGIANRVMEAALPAMNQLTDSISDPKFAEAAVSLANLIISGMNSIAQGAANAANNIRMLRDAFSSNANMSTEGLDGKMRELGLRMVELERQRIETETRLQNGGVDTLFGINNGALTAQLENIKTQASDLHKQEKEILDLLAQRQEDQKAQEVPLVDPGAGGGGGTKETLGLPSIGPSQEELEAQLQTLRDGLKTAAMVETDAFAERQKQLEDFLEMGMITKQDYDLLYQASEKDHWEKIKEIRAEAMTDLQKFNEMSFKDQAKTVFSELENLTAGVKNQSDLMFNINKGAAIANAVINTYEGISKSLSAYPMPLAAIMAGVHAAAGFAQVSSILATTRDTKGGSAKGIGSAGSAASAAQSSGAGTGNPNSSTMYVKGLDPNSLFSGDSVRRIAESLVQYQKDGGQVVFVQ